MPDALIHSDWLPIELPNDLRLLKLMLKAEEDFGERGEAIKGPIRRKISRLEKEKK